MKIQIIVANSAADPMELVPDTVGQALQLAGCSRYKMERKIWENWPEPVWVQNGRYDFGLAINLSPAQDMARRMNICGPVYVNPYSGAETAPETVYVSAEAADTDVILDVRVFASADLAADPCGTVGPLATFSERFPADPAGKAAMIYCLHQRGYTDGYPEAYQASEVAVCKALGMECSLE